MTSEEKQKSQEGQESQESQKRTSAQIDRIKKDMQITAKRVNFWLKVVLCVLLAFLTTGTLFLWVGFLIVGPIFLGTPTAVFLFALSGLMIVQPEERWVIEFLGKTYCIKKPGLRWVCPILMHKRQMIDTWEQKVLLFPKRRYPNGIHIDLKNGGKTQLVDPILWVQLIGAGTDKEDDSILRMTYAIDDWQDAVEENGENALRTHLNNLTVDEVLTAIHSRGKDSWWEAISEFFPNLGDTIKGYGIEAKRLTISDFNWDPQVVAERQRIFKEERSIKLAELSVEAAKDEVSQKALESGGLYGRIVKLLMQKQHGELSREEAMEVAKTLVLYYKGAETNSLVDVRTGEGNVAQLVAGVMGAVRGIAKGDQSLQIKKKSVDSSEPAGFSKPDKKNQKKSDSSKPEVKE